MEMIRDKWIVEEILIRYNKDTEMVEFSAEMYNGNEFIFDQVPTTHVPTFLEAVTDEEMNLSDQEEWYNKALEEAHKQNIYLSGEID
jgi:hypothetical protein